MEIQNQTTSPLKESLPEYGIRPFHLRRFMAGKPARTRGGREARFVGICSECEDQYQLVVYVKGDAAATCRDLQGRMRTGESRGAAHWDNPDDIWMAPKAIVGFFNVYEPAYKAPDGKASHFCTREIANINSNQYRVACIGPIQFCEGDGLE
jgi:hypothetical protein